VNDPQEVLSGLGPEPSDPNFTAEVLHQRLLASRRQLKPLLLDQAFLAGLGNIYTDEALNLARLHPYYVPTRFPGRSSSPVLSIRQVLEEGIRAMVPA